MEGRIWPYLPFYSVRLGGRRRHFWSLGPHENVHHVPAEARVSEESLFLFSSGKMTSLHRVVKVVAEIEAKGLRRKKSQVLLLA